MTGLDAVSVPVVEYVGVLLADAATPTVRLAVRVGVPDAPDDALAVELMDTDAPRVRLPERVLVLEKLIVSDGVEVALAVGGKDSDAETPCVFDAVAAVLLVAEAATERDTVTAAVVDADAPSDTDAVAFGVVAAVSDAVAAAEGDTVTAAVVDADAPSDTDAVAFGVVAAVSDAVAAAEGDTVMAAVVDADAPSDTDAVVFDVAVSVIAGDGNADEEAEDNTVAAIEGDTETETDTVTEALDATATAEADTLAVAIVDADGLRETNPLTVTLAGMLGETLVLALVEGDRVTLRPPVADVDGDASCDADTLADGEPEADTVGETAACDALALPTTDGKPETVGDAAPAA